jgi:hypothetical protein
VIVTLTDAGAALRDKARAVPEQLFCKLNMPLDELATCASGSRAWRPRPSRIRRDPQLIRHSRLVAGMTAERMDPGAADAGYR